MSNIDVPAAWESAAAAIASEGRRKILVLGVADVGKSTFCRFLYQVLLRTNNTVGIIDADIGQKDIGPPACITSGFPDPVGSQKARVADNYFVGAVTPVRHFLPMVTGVSALIGSTTAFFKIINTTGLALGIGRILKGFKIEAVKPDVIVAIQRSNELEPLLSAHRNYEILRIGSSSIAALKTPAQRRNAREAAYADYFLSAREVFLSIDELIFQRSLIFNGVIVEGSGFLYCERSEEGIIAVSGRKHERMPGLKVVPPGFADNLLCGVADKNNTVLGLALIRKIHLGRRRIKLLSPVEGKKIKIIQMGDVYVNSEGQELGSRKPGDF